MPFLSRNVNIRRFWTNNFGFRGLRIFLLAFLRLEKRQHFNYAWLGNIWIKIVNSKCDYMWALVQCKSIWSKASCKCWMSGNFGAWQMNRRIGRFNLTKHLNGCRGFRKIWPDLWMRDKFPAFYPLVKSRGAMGRPLINGYKCHTQSVCSMLQMLPFH